MNAPSSEDFPFLLPNINDSPIISTNKSLLKVDLLKVMFHASLVAWEKAIKPRMDKIRHDAVSKTKGEGTDFFTEADIESEAIITQFMFERFGKDAFRIFGEEKNEYIGNIDSEITIRIDPIDGTEAFKFGKANWSIMIGVYVSKEEKEQQILSTVYYPEYYNELLYHIEEAGTFIGSLKTKEVKEISTLDQQNNLSNIIIAYWKHSDLNKRGSMDAILKKLEETGARVRTISPTEVKEALITGGKRAMIIDGDFNQVDFISYSSLVKLGYQVYDWNGVQCNIDDPNLTDKKVVIVPPGNAGKQILKVISSLE